MMPILLQKEFATRHLFNFMSEEVRKVRYRLWNHNNLHSLLRSRLSPPRERCVTSRKTAAKETTTYVMTPKTLQMFLVLNVPTDVTCGSVINCSFYVSLFFYIFTISFIFSFTMWRNQYL